jgi:DNA-binding MarR family transcriptional regulator
MKADSAAIADLFETASLGSPQNAVGFVMWRVMHRYIREVDQSLRPLSLTHLQFTTLTLVGWMARSGQAATQAEVARFGDIHPMQVSNILKVLEQKRLIERTPAPGNALAKQVSMTIQGIGVLRAALPRVIAVQVRLFGTEGQSGGALLALLLSLDATASLAPRHRGQRASTA